MNIITRLGDKTGSVGALVAAMGCGMCFPAIASLGGALGLGFLEQWEWTLIDTLLPLFAWIALVLNGLSWINHRQWHRSLMGMIGPILLLLSLYPFFQYGWSAKVTYTALALMIAVSIWDIISPAHRKCDNPSPS
ncbi:MAG: organomercurial transporter MerC [Enterobacterales bacterium]|nr:organomercurial transporter MerC [Enterobacterales bacterium]